MEKAVQYVVIALIKLYQVSLSPLLGSHCRHTPSCSQYMVLAIRDWGLIQGIWLGIKRISRCHPWGTSGFDPVPKKPTHGESNTKHHS